MTWLYEVLTLVLAFRGAYAFGVDAYRWTHPDD